MMNRSLQADNVKYFLYVLSRSESATSLLDVVQLILQVVSSTNGEVNPDERPGREGSKEPITAQQEVEVVDETK